VLFADDAPTSSGSSFGGVFQILLLVLFVAALYFLFIRPNSKRRREQMELQAGIAPGDEVRTVGGLYGTVVESDADSVTLEASPGVHLRFDRQAISRVVTKNASEESTADDEDAAEDEDSEDGTTRKAD
jgi:preprotein translocase subunit YajC